MKLIINTVWSDGMMKHKKRVNARQKGLRVQRKAYTLGVSNGYRVHTANHSYYSKDIFGVADQIWIKYKEVIFVQVKSNQFRSLAVYQQFAQETGLKVLVLCWIDGKGWKSKAYNFNKGGIVAHEMA